MVKLPKLDFYAATCPRQASLVAQMVKNLPAMQETWVQSLGQEDPVEKRMATHSSILAWRIPWTEEPGGLQAIGLQRAGHDWDFHFHMSRDSEWNKVPEDRGAGIAGMKNGSGSTSSGRKAWWLDVKSVVCRKPFQVFLIKRSEALELTLPWTSFPSFSPSLGLCLVFGYSDPSLSSNWDSLSLEADRERLLRVLMDFIFLVNDRNFYYLE